MVSIQNNTLMKFQQQCHTMIGAVQDKCTRIYPKAKGVFYVISTGFCITMLVTGVMALMHANPAHAMPLDHKLIASAYITGGALGSAWSAHKVYHLYQAHKKRDEQQQQSLTSS